MMINLSGLNIIQQEEPLNSSCESSSFLQRLCVDILTYNILPYINLKKELATISMVSKHFKEILFSKNCEGLWNDVKSSFYLCIDTYCTNCLMRKLHRTGSCNSSIEFLKKFPIYNLKLHCFISDIPECMLALSSRKKLRKLDLTLTNKSSSSSLEELLSVTKFFPLAVQEMNRSDNTGSSNNNIIAYDGNDNSNSNNNDGNNNKNDSSDSSDKDSNKSDNNKENYCNNNDSNENKITNNNDNNDDGKDSKNDGHNNKRNNENTADNTNTSDVNYNSEVEKHRVNISEGSKQLDSSNNVQNNRKKDENDKNNTHDNVNSIVSDDNENTNGDSSNSSNDSIINPNNNNNNQLIYNSNNVHGDMNNNQSLFPLLTDLILDSSHLQHVNLAGRAKLLDILGWNLIILSFKGLSPPGVFSILSTRCPNLVKLRIDRALSLPDMSTYKSNILKELELIRCSYLLYPKSLDNFPCLKSLRYTPSFRCDSGQMESIISAAPTVLNSLSLEIPSQSIDHVISAISRRLYLLKNLSIQGAYELGVIRSECIQKLGRKCLFLEYLEVISVKSVSDLSFSQEGFIMLSSFPSLKKLKIKYDDVSINSVMSLLKQSVSLCEIILWERKKWISDKKWKKMELIIENANKHYPNCIIKLEAII